MGRASATRRNLAAAMELPVIVACENNLYNESHTVGIDGGDMWHGRGIRIAARRGCQVFRRQRTARVCRRARRGEALFSPPHYRSRGPTLAILR